MSKNLKIALAHDYLREYGGAERVLEQLHTMFPDAPVYVAFKDDQDLGQSASIFKTWDIRETWMAKIPLIKKLFSPLRFLAPKAFSDLDLSEYDVVISSSNAYFAKAIKVPNGTHMCYCHTPARSLYGYPTMMDWKKNPVIRIGGELINHYLRNVDFRVAQKVDIFIANSKETQKRITKFYRRESTIVYPPITTNRQEVTGDRQRELSFWNEVIESPKDPITTSSTPLQDDKKSEYWLFISRLAYSKNPQLAVEWATKTKQHLLVAGEGKMRPSLEKMAGPTVKFTGFVPDEKLPELYSHAKGLIYPVADEDFGMVPVEAMSYGVPVIAHNSGGPKETVKNGKTGILFDEMTVAGLTDAVAKAQETKWDKKTIRKHAEQFSADEFNKKIMGLVSFKGTGIRGQGSGNRDQGTGNRDQGTGNGHK